MLEKRIREPMYTVREVAAYLGAARETVYQWIQDDRVFADRDVCNQVRIPYPELRRLLREREVSLE